MYKIKKKRRNRTKHWGLQLMKRNWGRWSIEATAFASILVGYAQVDEDLPNIRKAYGEQKVSESIWNIVYIASVHIGNYFHSYLGQESWYHTNNRLTTNKDVTPKYYKPGAPTTWL